MKERRLVLLSVLVAVGLLISFGCHAIGAMETESGAGVARNILCRDIEMKNIVKDAIFFDSTYGCSYPSGGAGQFKDIVVKNVTCTATGEYGIYINGLPGTEHDNITLKNITIDTANKGGAYLKYCRNIKLNDVTIKNCKKNWIVDAETTSGLEFNNCTPKP